MKRFLSLLTLVTLADCGHPTPAPVGPGNDGWFHVTKSGTFTCPNQAVSVDGNRLSTTLDGECAVVRINGSHNDVVIYVRPAATIEVTGDRNTVVYRLIAPGPKPRWSNWGDSNQLLRNSVTAAKPRAAR